MIWIKRIICLFLCGWGVHAVQAAVVHLHTGETLQGKIQQMDDQTLTLESESGFGVLQIERAQVQLIEFDGHQRDLARKFGVGYYNAPSGIRGYGTNALSIKYWLSNSDAVDLLVGYSGTVSDGEKELEIFSFEPRFTRVFLQEANQNLYWGGSLGYISVTDSSKQLDDTGTVMRAFLGVELFLATWPNVGISAEVGVTNETIGKRTSMAVFNAGFPTLAMRYYF